MELSFQKYEDKIVIEKILKEESIPYKLTDEDDGFKLIKINAKCGY